MPCPDALLKDRGKFFLILVLQVDLLAAFFALLLAGWLIAQVVQMAKHKTSNTKY